jgi:phosphoribosylanthranilate isomerase
MCRQESFYATAFGQRTRIIVTTWIKICGITNLEDAFAAVDAGADAVGFVFHEPSPRHIDPAAARIIVQQLPGKIEKVGVFVNASEDRLARVVDQVGLTALQCSVRSQADANLSKIRSSVRRLIPLSVTLLLENQSRLQGLTAEFTRMSESRKPKTGLDTFLLDSSTAARPGGTGTTFDWRRAVPLVQVMSKSVKVIIAGGLTPENIGEAIRILRPWGVDVASGVESAPGRKDPEKVRAFVRAVRAADGAGMRN